MLDAAAYRLANDFQRGFPLTALPFRAIAAQVGVSEEEAIEKYKRLKAEGVVDRVGPVFRPNTVGASTLAALAVPPERLAAVAALVSAQPGVNHNYERGHRYNLWFVATGASEEEVARTLSSIESASGLEALRLPLIEEFHIDLGFDLATHEAPRGAAPQEFPETTAEERRLVAAAVQGFELVPEPYGRLAAKLGCTQERVLSLLGGMLADGRIRRIGAVVRHRPLGYEANAMAVWDVPDDLAGGRGAALGGDPAVTLCYRRARALPDWPYNLYCMVHGRDRARVLDEVNRLSGAHRLEAFPRAVLFSERCFSQRAARYG